MPDFSLVPVDHQPDFSDVSLAPVDHDPFGDEGGIRRAQAQPGNAPQQSAIRGDLPDVGTPAVGDGGQFSAGTAIGNNAADLASKVAYEMMHQLATLPQRAIDTARDSAAHTYGPGPDTLSDSDGWVDLLPAVAAETALTAGGMTGAARGVGLGQALAKGPTRAAESGFSQAERGVIDEARSIVTSPRMIDLAAAHGAVEPTMGNKGGRMVQYEPDLPASGMTMFGQNGFLLGPDVLSSSLEHNQTVLHELHRLSFSNSAGGVSADLAAHETKAAAGFAARAAKHLP